MRLAVAIAAALVFAVPAGATPILGVHGDADWSGTCAFNKNGSPRDAAHTTAWNRKALSRIAVDLASKPQSRALYPSLITPLG